MKFVYFLSILLLLTAGLDAQSIRGRVQDAQTGDNITGATIIFRNAGTTTGLDGTFVLQNVTSFPAMITASFIGYIPQEVIVEDASSPILIILEEDVALFAELVIVGANSGRTDAGAREMEKSAMNVINVMSARSIEISPDMTVANVIQRMSGVTLERNSNGDGQYALLRGMDKRFNYTLVNGVKIPSPDNRNRFVPLDIFPSELLDRLEVTKALTADMEGDGIGGAVNMVMKDAPSQLQVNANISTGFNTQFFSRNYQKFVHKNIDLRSPNQMYGLGYPVKTSDFSTQNLKLSERNAIPLNMSGGFSIGGRAFKDVLGIMLAASYSDAFRGSASDLYGSVGSDGVQLITQRLYSTQQRRIGTHAKFDVRINRNHKLTLYNAFMDFHNIQIRDAIEMGALRGDQTVRIRWNRQTIFSSLLKGTHNFADQRLRFDWALTYGSAFNRTPDNTTVRLRVEPDGKVNAYDGASRRWEENSDNDKTAYATITWITQIGSTKTEWSTGGTYRNKIRTSMYHDYRFRSVPTTQIKGEHWNNYDEISMEVTTASLNDPLNYDSSEEIKAVFAQVNTVFAKLQLTAGVRVEHSVQGYDLKFPLQGQESTGKQDYYEILPSFHTRYGLNDASNLRFSYFKAINRPSFFEVVPYRKLFEDYNEMGNPEIRHTVAHSLDLRYELFPRPSEQFMAGVFYKYIIDPIEYAMVPVGQDAFFMPVNLGNAVNAGVEIDFMKYFRVFGVKANYTLTNSQITSDKWRRVVNTDHGVHRDTDIEALPQTRRSFGQAAHVTNFSLLYKDSYGWDGQIALSYTDKRLAYISPFINEDIWQAGYLRLDASIEKNFAKSGLTIFAKVNNILDAPMFEYVNPNPNDARLQNRARKNGGLLDRKEYYGRNITVGLKYRL